MVNNKESPEALTKLEKNLKENVNYTPIKSPIKRLNYFWKDKEGNELTRSEFMQRWKRGLEGITPLQQNKSQVWSFRIMIIGILAGIVISIMGIKDLWWLTIILVGALFNTSIMYLGVWQKVKLLERIEKVMQGGIQK